MHISTQLIETEISLPSLWVFFKHQFSTIFGYFAFSYIKLPANWKIPKYIQNHLIEQEPIETVMSIE